MHIPKKYFHDRLVLLLISVNTFITLVSSILITLRLDGNQANSYWVAYRSNQGLNRFRTGSASQIIAFVLFMALVLGLHTVLSIRTYNMRRHFSIAALISGTLLLVLAAIVSNALLVLR